LGEFEKLTIFHRKKINRKLSLKVRWYLEILFFKSTFSSALRSRGHTQSEKTQNVRNTFSLSATGMWNFTCTDFNPCGQNHSLCGQFWTFSHETKKSVEGWNALFQYPEWNAMVLLEIPYMLRRKICQFSFKISTIFLRFPGIPRD